MDGGISQRAGSAERSIGRWIQEYNHDRPHHGVQNRTPHEAFLLLQLGNQKRDPDCLN